MKVYLAKDKNGKMFVYNYKPVNIQGIWTCKNGICKRGFFGFPFEEKDLPEGVNPQWEDEEPIEVEMNITKVSDDVVAIPKDRYERLLQYEQEYISRQSMVNSFMQNK